jgi:uncharacterized protein YndB with AHSA1/START domain
LTPAPAGDKVSAERRRRHAPVPGGLIFTLPASADIRCPAEKIFDVITDFDGQDRWLAKSSAFRGTTAISSGPVTLGTTYVEPGPFGVRNGKVTEFERRPRA